MGKQRNDKQQSPTVEHKELYSIFSDKPHEKEFKIHMYIFMYITESHCCAVELNATLKVNHTSVKILEKKKSVHSSLSLFLSF